MLRTYLKESLSCNGFIGKLTKGFSTGKTLASNPLIGKISLKQANRCLL